MSNKGKYIMNFNDDGRDTAIPDLVGARRRIIIDSETEVPSEVLTYGLATFQGKTSFHKKHAHNDCEEIMYIVSGRGIGGVGDGPEVTFEPGDTIFAPKGVVHWMYNPFDEPCEMIWIYTKPSLATAGYALESTGFKEVGKDVDETDLNMNDKK